MLDSNEAFFRVATNQSFLTPSHSAVIELYSGTMPDDSIFLDEANYSNNTFDMDKIRAALNVDNTKLAGLGFEPAIIAEYEGKDRIVFPLSDSTREFHVYEAGTATWFMMHFYPGDVNDPDPINSMKSSQVIIGTVGDLASGEDLELPGATVSLDRDFKSSDVVINLV